MATEFVFEDKELREFFKNTFDKLKEIQNGTGKFVGLMSAIVFRDVMDHFKEEQGSDGAWAPWSEIYKKHMQKIGRAGNKKLQFTGRLRNSFQPDNVKKVSKGLLWFNNAQINGFPYAAAHDEGGDRLPQREFMWLSDKGAEQLSEQVLAFMKDEAK